MYGSAQISVMKAHAPTLLALRRGGGVQFPAKKVFLTFENNCHIFVIKATVTTVFNTTSYIVNVTISISYIVNVNITAAAAIKATLLFVSNTTIYLVNVTISIAVIKITVTVMLGTITNPI